jgi:hypothetical protein
MLWNIPADQQERSNPMKTQSRRPNNLDETESWIVDDAFAEGLYNGTMPGFKLASALVFPIVSVPVAFMGLPIPVSKSKNKASQAMLDLLIKETAQTLTQVFTNRRKVGTGWVWPNYDAKLGKIVDELIPNASVVDIIKDHDNGSVKMIITDEQMTIQTGENRQSVIRKKRYFTPQSVKVEYSGDVPPGLANRTMKNPSGVMPIWFPMGSDGRKCRGNPAVMRVVSHLKNYHDNLLKWHESQVKFNTKMFITGIKNVSEFLKNNGLTSLSEVDVSKGDLLLLQEGEAVDMTFASGMGESFKILAEVNFINIVEGVMVPEIAFGISTTGNHASAEQDMTVLANTVNNEQAEVDRPVREYFAARLRLMAGAGMLSVDQDFDISWNDIEVVSQEVKAKILQAQADAIAKLDVNASLALEDKHKWFLAIWPRTTEPDFEKWKAGLSEAAKFKQYRDASLTDAADMVGAV